MIVVVRRDSGGPIAPAPREKQRMHGTVFTALFGSEASQPAPEDLGAGQIRIRGQIIEKPSFVGIHVDLNRFTDFGGGSAACHLIKLINNIINSKFMTLLWAGRHALLIIRRLQRSAVSGQRVGWSGPPNTQILQHAHDYR